MVKSAAQLDREIAQALSARKSSRHSAVHATKKQDYDWDSFTDGAAFAFWAAPYASEVENLAEDSREARYAGDERKAEAFMAAYRALSPGPGGSWRRTVGDPPPAARAVAKKFTKQVRDTLTDDQLAEVFAAFSAENAGYKGAMQAQGEGVGWHDEGVKVQPPRGYDYDVKIANAVGRAITRDARDAGAPLPSLKQRSGHATIAQHSDRGDRVLADLKRWGIDREQLDEVRRAFRAGDHRRAMGLARDLGWNRSSKRGRS